MNIELGDRNMKNRIRIKFREPKQETNILIMVILLGFCVFLTYYFHAILKTGVIFTHFFYVPIILAILWWRRKGLVVVVFLAAFLNLCNIFLKPGVTFLNYYI